MEHFTISIQTKAEAPKPEESSRFEAMDNRTHILIAGVRGAHAGRALAAALANIQGSGKSVLISSADNIDQVRRLAAHRENKKFGMHFTFSDLLRKDLEALKERLGRELKPAPVAKVKAVHYEPKANFMLKTPPRKKKSRKYGNNRRR